MAGLDAQTARLLRQLITQHVKTPGKIVLPRRIRPGAILVREWKGGAHRVTVVTDGFAYESKTYDSLSQIARADHRITLERSALLSACGLTKRTNRWRASPQRSCAARSTPANRPNMVSSSN